MTGRLAGRIALVTGAGTRSARVSGVGMATAKRLAVEGASVVVLDRDESAATVTVEAIVAGGGGANACVADVTDEEACRLAVAAALDRHGRLDILVNAVGVSGDGDVTQMTEEGWDHTLDTDLRSMAFLCKHAIPAMIRTGGGAIVNIASVDGLRAGMKRNLPYAAAKGGMVAATRAMAVHHGRDGIRVNCIAPGLLYTSMTEGLDEQRRAARRQVAPLGTEGRAEDVAMAAAFLVSDEARWITGVVLPVDAGLMAAGPQATLDDWMSRDPAG